MAAGADGGRGLAQRCGSSEARVGTHGLVAQAHRRPRARRRRGPRLRRAALLRLHDAEAWTIAAPCGRRFGRRNAARRLAVGTSPGPTHKVLWPRRDVLPWPRRSRPTGAPDQEADDPSERAAAVLALVARRRNGVGPGPSTPARGERTACGSSTVSSVPDFTGDVQKGFEDEDGRSSTSMDDLGIADERTFDVRGAIQFKRGLEAARLLHAARLPGRHRGPEHLHLRRDALRARRRAWRSSMKGAYYGGDLEWDFLKGPHGIPGRGGRGQGVRRGHRAGRRRRSTRASSTPSARPSRARRRQPRSTPDASASRASSPGLSVGRPAAAPVDAEGARAVPRLRSPGRSWAATAI